MPADTLTSGTPGGPVAARKAPRLPGWFGPVCLVVVVTAALLAGSGIGGGRQTPTQRAQAIEAQVRCPSCEDLSVLDSSASVAVSVRHQIVHEIDAGWTDQRILDQLVARYGPSILLRPPTSGLTSLVWIVPAVAGAAALGAVGVLFYRRARQMRDLRQDAP